ncbi:hypothetical protein LPC08_20580 [Roseomonas sp. OT10]|nr:hypothetical protein [Roseomonas sp. OT10]UFN48383.1 hypothetical protein LPC08_20580 [Roseomonas sp. OT10]
MTEMPVDPHAEIREEVATLCARVCRVAPISTNLMLFHPGEHVLGMPRGC